jgi:glyoxylase-like metal-dependent hydrolase (beta-lactamase superfamily II)
MGPTLGFLPAHLGVAGVDIDEIETVFLTHMHPDHSNGLTDAEGRRVFPASEIALADAEMRHWQDDAAMAAAPERKRERYFRAARKQLDAYRDQLRPFTSEAEVFPGVIPVPIAGHTPGHTAYLIADGDDSLLIWGDTVHVPHIQIRFPHVTLDFDSDEAAAAAMRRRLLEMAATDKILVGGMHLDFPGFGFIGREGDGYRFFAAPWNPIL